MTEALSYYPLRGLPLVEPGDDLCALALAAFAGNNLTPLDDDLLIVAQKIVSKAENRLRRLDAVEPTAQAQEWAKLVDKDARLVQLILDESNCVLRHRPGAMIVEHRLGYVHANAGIDASNVEDPNQVLLLPEDPDRSALELHQRLRLATGCHINVSIIDSAGRAWRTGICGFTLGSAGFEVLRSRVGAPDLYGRPLEITEVAVADELAGAASYLMGQANEGIAAVLVRGAALARSQDDSRTLIRPREMDLFR